jgi:hypothetical protein
VSDEPALTTDRLTPTSQTIHLRLPHDDLCQVKSLVPSRFIDIPGALRSMIRKGLRVELEGSSNG